MKSIASSFALGLSILAVGCGSLAGNADSPRVLASLHGQLDNPQSLALKDNVRVAVIWRGFTKGDFSVAQDLPVQPVFPSSFHIDLDGPPPASAMNKASDVKDPPSPTDPTGPNEANGSNGSGATPPSSGGSTPTPAPSGGSGPGPKSARNGIGAFANFGPAGGGVHTLDTPGSSQIPADFEFAVGQVVAYVDQNGNGKLDLVDDTATNYVDQIVGANSNMLLMYFTGTLPLASMIQDTAGNMPSLGYNLYEMHDCEVELNSPAPGTSSNGSTLGGTGGTGSSGTGGTVAVPTCTPSEAWHDLTMLYDLPVSTDPTLSDLMCVDGSSSGAGLSSASGGLTSSTCTGTTTVALPSYPSGGICSPDGSYVTYTKCTTTDQGPCKGTYTECDSTVDCRPSTVPANWPCTGSSSSSSAQLPSSK